ncbi:MAG: endonuclease/exonuclease/phosphatase family protein [Thermoplasmata archaeon]|nr:endonuclease/exonuclease/phosphatase family protein [Thermoplasmata archaeon]
MRVVLYNLQYGGGSDKATSYLIPATRKRRLKNLEAIIESLIPLRPDVLGMIEADAGSWRMAGIDMAQEISKALDLPYLDEDCKYPNPVDRIPLISYNIAALATKQPLLEPSSLELSVGFKRKVLRARTGGVTFIVAHLSLLGRSRRKQVADLARFAREAGGPVVVMGDLNAVPDDPELEPLASVADLERVPLGMTFPSWNPKKALDHFFVSEHIQVLDAWIPDIHLSDHMPIVMDVETRGP